MNVVSEVYVKMFTQWAKLFQKKGYVEHQNSLGKSFGFFFIYFKKQFIIMKCLSSGQ